jgi:outer membrane protein OmpA-like peptidoglycan-associated protein
MNKFILAAFAAICFHSIASAANPHGLFELYAANRAEGRPNLITADLVLVGYSMALDREIAEGEAQTLLPETIRLVDELARSLASGPDLPSGSNAPVDVRNYLAVIQALLKGENPAQPPAVAAELTRVREAAGIARSGLMRQSLDYSQFRPRGRYTQTPALERYFLATRYAGSVLFPVTASRATAITEEDADALTAEALLLARAFAKNSKAREHWAKIDSTLTALFGRTEDLTADDLNSIRLETPLRQARSTLLEGARRRGRQPTILAGPVDTSLLEPGLTSADALTGFRLFPARFTPDGAAMQQLVYDRVKLYRGDGHPASLAVIGGRPVKAFPQAREIMALLGSEEAVRQLDATDERNYDGYPEAFHAAAEKMRGGDDLTSRQLRIVRDWMRAGAGETGTRLQSALAFWTWTRYNNFLYAKQSYTTVVKGLPIIKPRDKAWIEPSSDLYLSLASQIDSLQPVLWSEKLAGLAQLLRRCAEISVIESAGAQLPADQVEFLNGLDLSLLQFTGRPDSPIIVDVHSEPNSGLVLEEAVGFPAELTHTLADGTSAVGGRFTHREFKQTLAHRLNDGEWLTMLEKEEAERVAHGHAGPVWFHIPAAGMLLPVIAQSSVANFADMMRLGADQLSRGDTEQARQSFARAFALAGDPRQAALAAARLGEALDKLGHENEAIEYMERSLELNKYEKVETELKEMRKRRFSRTQSAEEIRQALDAQQASNRGTRVLPARAVTLRILFEFDKAALTPEGKEQVEKLAEALAVPELVNERIRIVGHTDLIGGDDYNQKLSERRAAAVAAEIVGRHSLPMSQIEAAGKGKREPLYPGTSDEDSMLNRRVEVSLIP